MVGRVITINNTTRSF